MKASNDGGATWGDLVTLYSGRVDFLAAQYEAATNIIHLHVQEGGSTVLYSQVQPDGSSYTPLTQINPVLPPTIKTVTPAVGTGVTINGELCAEPTCGGTTGRVIIPFVCHGAGSEAGNSYGPGDIACKGCYSCLLFSDDHGKSWTFGALSAQDGSREASPVQLQTTTGTGAVIYANERNMGNATGVRLRAVSRDSGATFDPSSYAPEPSLPDGCTANWTGVVSGASRYDTHSVAGMARRVIFTGPASRSARVDLGLWVSSDETHSWTQAPALLWKGPAAYSNVAQLNATHAIVIFENGEDEFAQRISVAVISVADLPPAAAESS